MNTNLVLIFKQSVSSEFSFLTRDYGYNLSQENPWRYFFQKDSVKIVMEFDGKSLGCWVERGDLSKSYKYHSISVNLISTCFGYKDPKEILFRPKEEMLISGCKLYSALLRRYCLDFVRGDFSKWENVVEILNSKD
jgi:hypothetical protein